MISDLLKLILKERDRQEQLKAQGKFSKTCADDLTNAERLTVLAEEFGEVAKCVCDEINGKNVTPELRAELAQVAAVCLGWLQGLEK